MIIWSLFDSGNGCYSKVLKSKEGVKNISIGIDKEQANTNHLVINLADLSSYFGKSNMIKELEKIPKPDVIIASPPCESWSLGSTMTGGNACWKHTKGKEFIIRKEGDYLNIQYKMEKSFYNRINGELTTFNLIKIIKHFEPKVYIIENPAYSKIWEYIERVLSFHIPYDNLTYYNNYGFDIKKPTKFKSNINLNLNSDRKPANLQFRNYSRSYNTRSNIPLPLIEDIYKQLKEELK